MKVSLKTGKQLIGTSFILPWLLGFAVFTVFPLGIQYF